MRYSTLVKTYEQLSSTTKRLEKTEILAKFFQVLGHKDKEVLYLIIGRVFPDYDERETGISTQLTIKALSKASGVSEENITKEWRKVGDLGEVAQALTQKKQQTTLSHVTLTTEKVLNNIRKLPELVGKGTVDKKLSLISELLSSATPEESKYIIRTLLGDLRIGTKTSTIRDALAKAFFKEDEKSIAVEAIQHSYDLSPDLAELFEKSKAGLTALQSTTLEPGKPIKVMLAQKAENIEKAFEKTGKPAVLEYKYDGFRVMINKNEKTGEVKLYTRRLENVSTQFPEIVQAAKTHIKGKSFIIDSEIIGYNPKTKKHVPFQAISQRIKRKYDIEKLVKSLPVEIKAFDIIQYNGKNLIKEPFEKRTQILRKIIKPEKMKISASEQLITSDEAKVSEFYKKAIADNQEGLMIKSLQAPYKPGSRVGHMLKLKDENRDLDLVITGAEYGTGKRGGWLSSFILSCRDGDEFLEIGKMSTGLKEKDLEDGSTTFRELTKKLKPLIIKTEGRVVQVKPKIVLSVTYQEIQKSPTYGSGFALRFPRFTALREDRGTSDIATLRDVESEYKMQKK
jgi:DNA ligase 1